MIGHWLLTLGVVQEVSGQWVTVLTALGVAVVSGGGGAAIVSAIASRRTTRVDATIRLSDAALKYAEELTRDNEEMRREVSEARREASEARREMSSVRVEAEALAAELRALRTAAMDPNATIERIRLLIGGKPPDPLMTATPTE